ncbi:hypothetical protein M408DRAFT_327275 [Serendipita vermifera MAFF 305830]|uniref:Uncharacterized protein n=1 Tax=Serendipita vermifera MAFF 305830 TaxID=933852 RepID=A0A0C2XSE5_SERVB|nr:hypothetical protein M408DRAFT_327275 [Serendipita vermifera MAFF 305830]
MPFQDNGIPKIPELRQTARSKPLAGLSSFGGRARSRDQIANSSTCPRKTSKMFV